MTVSNVTEDELKAVERCARQIGHVDGFTVVRLTAEIRTLWQRVAEYEGALLDPDFGPFE